jgi:hypothetical protein
MVPKIKPMILWKLQSNKRKGTILVRKRWGKVDDLVKSPEARHCEERSDEASIKRPLSRGKNFPRHEFLIFLLGKLWLLEPWENVTLANAEISTRTMSAPFSGLCCTKHPSGSRSGNGVLLFSRCRIGYEGRISYPILQPS